MLDFGWQEFLLIAIVTVVIVGPKELPRVFRTITGFMRKARSLAGEFHSAMDEMAREADLEDLKKEASKIKDGSSDWVKDIDPTGEVGKSVKDFKTEVDGARNAVNKEARDTAPSPGGTTPKPVVSDDRPAEPANKTEAKKAEDKKSPAKKASAKKAAAKKTAAKKSGTKKAAAKKAAAKKAPASGEGSKA